MLFRSHLGNTDASRDWGSAKEYMEAAWLMLQQETPDDYVIATGETHTVKEFITWVENAMGTKLKVTIDPKYIRPHDVQYLCGDATKAKEKLGFIPQMKGEEIAKWMVYDQNN